MAVKLPCELEEEILSRLPCRSIVRFRSVCKEWNGLFNYKSFRKKQYSRSRPQFILLTESKIYSIEIDLVGVDSTIEVCEIPYDFPFQLTSVRHTSIAACDGLLFCEFWRRGTAVWNPWLRQFGWIEHEGKGFQFCGVGYDTSKCYKILGYSTCLRSVSDTCDQLYDRFAIYECASQAFKFIDAPFRDWFNLVALSVNGNLYWLSHNPDAVDECFIRSFDFSREIFKPFCLLPCQKNYSFSQLDLAVFEGGRFSLLKNTYEESKIEIWVTKHKIIIDDDRDQVVWTKLMTLPTTNVPRLLHKICGISYFIFEDKTLIMCLGDEQTRGAPCIFVVREDMCKKFQIDSGIFQFCHSVYLPNLISVPLEFRPLPLRVEI